jgi:lipocalin
MPNMLAPLLGGAPVLNTYYPPDVRQYLDSVPANEDPKRGSRLEQLRSAWVKVGRLDASDSVQQRQKVAALTTSQSKDVKVSIDDLTDRIAMLADVSGRASLMKRDLAVLMRSYGRSFQDCKSPTAANP